LAGELLNDANHQVQVFVNTVITFTDQPVPAADDPGRPAWVQGIKWALDKTFDILVAATFAVNAVQLAAERTVSEAVAGAGRAFEYAGQARPSLVVLGAVALQAAVGVLLVKKAWEAVRSARAEEAASPGNLERDPAPASHPQQPAADDRQEVTPTTLQAGRHAEEPIPGPGQPAMTTPHVFDQQWDTGSTDLGAGEAVIRGPQGEVVPPPLPVASGGTIPTGEPASGAREERDALDAAEAADSR
jgi:hypothetical protein